MSKPQKTILVAAILCVAAGIAFGAIRASAGSGPTQPLMSAENTPASAVSTVASQVVNGQTWSLSSFTNRNGRVCLRENVPPGAGADSDGGTACADPNGLFTLGSLHLETDLRTAPSDSGRWSSVWVYGWSASGVTTLVAQMRDCSTVPMEVASGVFSRVFGTGDVPQRLIAYRADGSIMQEVQVPIPQSPSANAIAATTC